MNVFQFCLTENRWPNCNIRWLIFVEPKAGKNSLEYLADFGNLVADFGLHRNSKIGEV